MSGFNPFLPMSAGTAFWLGCWAAWAPSSPPADAGDNSASAEQPELARAAQAEFAAAVATQPHLALETLLGLARARFEGVVTEIELELRDGALVAEIELLTPGGESGEVVLDASSGEEIAADAHLTRRALASPEAVAAPLAPPPPRPVEDAPAAEAPAADAATPGEAEPLAGKTPTTVAEQRP
jgi:hypothetical protein